MSTTVPTTDELLGLAEAIVAQGFDAHRSVLAEVVQAARRAGVRQVLVDIVDDDAAPVVARQRALGRVIVAMGDIARRSLDPAGAPSLTRTAA